MRHVDFCDSGQDHKNVHFLIIENICLLFIGSPNSDNVTLGGMQQKQSNNTDK